MTLLLTGAFVAPVEARAQDTRAEERECRCVDREGNEIENCRCFGGFDFSFELPSFGRARLGVLVNAAQAADVDRMGVRLQEVVDGSPADQAGLRDGDVVVRIGGRSVLEQLDPEREAEFEDDESRPVQRFLSLARELEPEEPIEVVYLRDGEERTTTLTPERDTSPFGAYGLGDGGVLSFGDGGNFRFRMDPDDLEKDPEVLRYNLDPDARAFRFFREGESDPNNFGVLFGSGDPCLGSVSGSDASSDGRFFYLHGGDCVDGVRLQDLNEQLATYFEVDGGVLVTEVLEGSTLGLRAGDVIRSVGDREVEDVDDVRRVLRSYETDEPVIMSIVRRGDAMQVRGTRR